MPKSARPVLTVTQLTAIVREDLHKISQRLLFEDRRLNSLRQFRADMSGDDLHKLKQGLQEVAMAVRAVTEQFTIKVLDLSEISHGKREPHA